MLRSNLSLDCLTLGNVTPQELICSASKAGFNLVSLWLQAPSLYPAQILRADAIEEALALLNDTGVRVHALEAFDLVSPKSVSHYRPALELGARLGARTILAIHRTNPDRMEVVDALSCLVELAAQIGLKVNLEPIAMGYTRTLAEAYGLIRDSQTDTGIIYDTWHFVRSGGGLADLTPAIRELIRHVQICDGAADSPVEDWPMEAATERLYPGEGAFPLLDLLADIPRDIPWAIETPSLRRARGGILPETQAVDAYRALERLLTALEHRLSVTKQL
jgi:sugar phosphate isomerase/epimerase